MVVWAASGLRSQAASVKLFIQEKEKFSQEHVTWFWEVVSKFPLCMRQIILKPKVGRELSQKETWEVKKEQDTMKS